VARAAGRAIKKRYVSRGGGLKMSRIAKDVMMLKTMVNAEKEIYAQNISATTIGASLGQTYFQPITNIAEGTLHGQRDGESVKLHGFRWHLRALQQSSRVNPGNVKLWLVKYIGPRGTTPNINTFLKPDFDGLFTTHSARNEDWYKQYQIISSASLYCKADAVSGVQMQRYVKKYGRFTGQTHQRYGGTAATDLLTDQMYIIGVCDGGSSALNAAFQFDSQLTISFYDN